MNIQIPSFEMLHSLHFLKPSPSVNKDLQHKKNSSKSSFVQVNEFVWQILSSIYNFDSVILKFGTHFEVIPKQELNLQKSPNKVFEVQSSQYLQTFAQNNNNKKRKSGSSMNSFRDSISMVSSIFGGVSANMRNSIIQNVNNHKKYSNSSRNLKFQEYDNYLLPSDYGNANNT